MRPPVEVLVRAANAFNGERTMDTVRRAYSSYDLFRVHGPFSFCLCIQNELIVETRKRVRHTIIYLKTLITLKYLYYCNWKKTKNLFEDHQIKHYPQTWST